MALPQKIYSLKDKHAGNAGAVEAGLEKSAKARAKAFAKERTKPVRKPGIVGRAVAAIKRKVSNKKR